MSVAVGWERFQFQLSLLCGVCGVYKYQCSVFCDSDSL